MSSDIKKSWESHFHYDAISPLIESGNKAIILLAYRDLKNQNIEVQDLWQEKEAQRILKKQISSGFWK
jgi:hypothetical protein